MGYPLRLVAMLLAVPATAARTDWAEIRVVDDVTGRGVPLVELETVNGLLFVTDNAGRVAIAEPGLIGREVYLSVRSHGYGVKKDGFGYAGARITPRPGQPAEIRIARHIPAERLCRLTGEGRDRDSLLLGYKPLIVPSLNPGRVAGQDSVQAAIYRGQVYWFWGDTQRMEYPLGLFRTAGATTAIPSPSRADTDPARGIAFNYFTDPKTGFARAMMPLAERPQGVIWISGLCVAPDDAGVEKLVCHYTRRKGLEREYEQGIAAFNDEKVVFESRRQLPLDETWRRPAGHPIVHDVGGVRWLLFGSPNPNVRCRANFASLLDPAGYESFTCAKADSPGDPDIDSEGRPSWRWQKQLPPADSKTELRWIRERKLKPEHARFCPADAAHPAERIQLHSGTVRWNEHRRRWLLIAGQVNGKPSHLGEVWYAEANAPTGPFSLAVKVLTHDRQSFYNVCHHTFLDRDSGRSIHFEGTYTRDFSGNPHKTPRYEYNQILYRLDLDSPALKPARGG